MIWFRLYSEFRNDPKLATFSKGERYDIIHLFCIASECEIRGTIDLHDEDIAAALGLEMSEYETFIKRLEVRGIVARTDAGLVVSQWQKRQYDKPSDAPERVAERVAKYRSNQRETPRETPPVHACNANVTRCNALDTDTELDTESTHYVRETRVRGQDTPIRQPDSVPSVESSPLFAAVLELTGKTTHYRAGTISPNFRVGVAKVVGMLQADGRTVEDVERYRQKLPAFLGKPPPDVTPPQPNQILDNFDRVLAHTERHGKPSPTARKLGAILDRQNARRAAAGIAPRGEDGGTGNTSLVPRTHGRT